ncbi:hypothetical protein [Sphingobacterium thalpophilum]|uniref:hypothetical protein n=1 Tax=Sphingobacterium thalpophilum TaxID=259 RepID=UPI0024A60F98|nr:hypothetical protein [Sphingobacterium thalpophilum]
MKNTTIVEGINENFVLIDQEADKASLKAYYVMQSKYNDGYFEEEDIICITIDFVTQGADVIVGGWEYPRIEEQKLRPCDDGFNYEEAEQAALEAANQLILNYEFAKV